MTVARAVSRLDVEVHGSRVGVLERDRHGGIRFTPDRNWLQAGQVPPLGWSFLVDPKPRVVRGCLPHWFENLLPEIGSGLRSWLCRERQLRERDSAAILAAIGRDLPGAVQVLGVMEDLDAPLSETPSQGKLRFSLAGMQLKLSMLLSGNRFSLPVRGDTGRWIVKIPGGEFPDLPDVEYATMLWARSAGFEMPDFHPLSVDEIHGVDRLLLGQPTRAFAIKRFDRVDDGRVHQEDFAQVLSLPPGEKYGDGHRAVSYDGLARLVHDACGEGGQQEFVRRLAFVVASGNGDAHLKNWSFQWGRHDHRPWLSPSYDLVATIAWPARFGWELPGGPCLALGLGRTRRFAELDGDRLGAFAERAHSPQASALFIEALESCRAAWAAVTAVAPARMREAVTTHWERVPLLRALGPLPRG